MNMIFPFIVSFPAPYCTKRTRVYFEYWKCFIKSFQHDRRQRDDRRQREKKEKEANNMFKLNLCFVKYMGRNNVILFNTQI